MESVEYMNLWRKKKSGDILKDARLAADEKLISSFLKNSFYDRLREKLIKDVVN